MSSPNYIVERITALEAFVVAVAATFEDWKPAQLYAMGLGPIAKQARALNTPSTEPT